MLIDVIKLPLMRLFKWKWTYTCDLYRKLLVSGNYDNCLEKKLDFMYKLKKLFIVEIVNDE